MKTKKKLVIVVDCSLAMQPYWSTICGCYLNSIVRCFCGEGCTLQAFEYFIRTSQFSNAWWPAFLLKDLHETKLELGLVPCNSSNYPSATASCWTGDMSTFFDWLSKFRFDGPDHDNNAIAEGLSEALAMFLANSVEEPQWPYQTEDSHCILVAASDSFIGASWPRFGSFTGNATKVNPIIAENVAAIFSQFFVSLSVISPFQLPILTEIFKAGNLYVNATVTPVNQAKHDDYLVLISDKFIEAHAALTVQITYDLDIELSEEDLLLLRQVMEEPLNNPSTKASTMQMEHMNHECFATAQQNFAALQFFGAVPGSQTHGNYGAFPFIGSILQSSATLCPHRHFLSSSAAIASNRFSSYSPPSRGISSLTNTADSIKTQRNHFTLSASISDLESRIGTSKHLYSPISSPSFTSNLNAYGNSILSSPGATAISTSNPQVTQNAIVRSEIAALDAGPVSKGLTSPRSFGEQSTPDSMVDRQPGMMHKDPQKVGINQAMTSCLAQSSSSSGVNKSTPVIDLTSDDNDKPQLPTSTNVRKDNASGDGYVKVWEGSITAKINGQITTISELSAYGTSSASRHFSMIINDICRIACHWPSVLHLDSISYHFDKISVPDPNLKLLIKGSNNHPIFQQMQTTKQCCNITLPSQKMILSMTNRECHYHATIFPPDQAPDPDLKDVQFTT